jgi:hypothetical protein
MTLEKRYEYAPDVISDTELAQELDKLWDEVQKPGSDLNQKAKARGIDVEQLGSMKREEALDVRREKGGGLSDIAISLIVAVAPTVAEYTGKIIWSLWEDVFLPRIRGKKGDDALEEQD